MREGELESLLEKAVRLERSYDWLDAANCYIVARKLVLNKKDFLRGAQICDKLGRSFYRSAFQAETSIEFKDRIQKTIKAYEKQVELLKKVGREAKPAEIYHATGLIAFAKHWLETSPAEKKKLLNRSIALEKQALAFYESSNDRHSVGKTCNSLMQYLFIRYWFASDNFEGAEITKEGASFGEKAINALANTDDFSEIASAYTMAGKLNVLTFTANAANAEAKQRGQNYIKKALELSQKTGDAGLIGSSHGSAWNIAQYFLMNPHLAIAHAKESIKCGFAARDNFAVAHANGFLANSLLFIAKLMEDPDKQKENLEKVVEMAEEAANRSQIFNYVPISLLVYPMLGDALRNLASIEINSKRKQSLFEKAIRAMQEGSDLVKGWGITSWSILNPLSQVLFSYSVTKKKVEEKRKLLSKAEYYAQKFVAHTGGSSPFMRFFNSQGNYQLALVQEEFAKTETDDMAKIRFLGKALACIEKSIETMEKLKENLHTDWTRGYCYGPYYWEFGKILRQIHSTKKEENFITKAILAYEKATSEFDKANLPASVAEAQWNTAQLYDQIGKYQEASNNYESSSEAYELAAKKIPQLKEFYKDYSQYMQAWSQLEKARLNHSVQEYSKARQNYEKAAELHESTGQWSYLAPNYSAWAVMEEAEGLSRKENTQQAKVKFKQALEQFAKAEKTVKDKIGEITSAEEKGMTRKLLQASNLRREYCQARILVEDAKLLDRDGKYLQSSKSYSEAADNFSRIVDGVDVEAERKELEYLETLCRAWEKMAVAEERTSSEAYLEAADFFEKAKTYCFTRKASLWALGNSNFCRGLAAGVQYQTRLDLAEHARAKGYMKNASTNYVQAGFENAAEYAKATQRLFDAYVFMNQAESELNQEKRAKQYQLAENLLQIAAGSFMKAKQPEKTAQVKGILANVREEKTLAISLNDVMHAPTITSSTLSFTAPTPTTEASVGLESFEHANVQANLVVGLKEVRVGESFCLSVEFVNAGKEPALLTRVEDFVPPEFVVVKKPEIYRLENSCLNMKGKQIAPLKLVEAKVVLQPSKKGIYQLNPKAHYLDENGQNKLLQLKSVEIKVEEVVLENRVSTGTKELDALLLGGIPEECAVVLTGSPNDERELVIKNFLEAGIGEGQTSFYAATEADGLENLLEKPNFYLFLCNPRPKVRVSDLSNVYKLHSKSDINNLNIALFKAYRTIDQSSSKRICLNVVSDVLLEYRVRTTRKWLAELTTDLISKGFTILSVINPQMHTPEELSSVLDLFDGEISLTQTKDALECKKSIRIEKLRNQDYIKNPICLTKQKKIAHNF